MGIRYGRGTREVGGKYRNFQKSAFERDVPGGGTEGTALKDSGREHCINEMSERGGLFRESIKFEVAAQLSSVE